MKNIYTYVEKHGNVDFKHKKFNDIDNLVFSLISYLDFSNTNINNGKFTLEVIGKEYLNIHKYRDIRKLGIAQKDAYKLLELIIKKDRYKNIIVSNYVYDTSKDIQFSALTFNISHKLKCIYFEGTDELVSGWKEDGELACFFPIPSHIEAIKYVNSNVKLFGPDVIIGGHSKGGNLALVAAMYMDNYKKFKVKKIYSNDGPGLRKKEFESKEYQKIKKKYVHIVPHSSIVGILLRNDSYVVIKSSLNNIFAHAISTWLIDDDKLVPSALSEKSKRLERNLLNWLDEHDDEERLKFVNNLFKVLEDADINDLVSIHNINNILKIVYNMRNIDKQTKDMFIDLLTYNYKNNPKEYN